MSVYVLWVDAQYADDGIRGVFSSRENCIAHMKTLDGRFLNYDDYIQEVTLDVPID